ncbi:hypothetical protein PoB_004813300 [Plakobranchus ocellatus]|uniref:Uncharacterized protein n=1 Tax=Plakobranchus ocellatus TaxID=259542 RepID=A0AAV4BS10_9GAST|nr:hypothetical protein PoB_004813300 [Plakobranchus ocellatus]
MGSFSVFVITKVKPSNHELGERNLCLQIDCAGSAEKCITDVLAGARLLKQAQNLKVTTKHQGLRMLEVQCVLLNSREKITGVCRIGLHPGLVSFLPGKCLGTGMSRIMGEGR